MRPMALLLPATLLLPLSSAQAQTTPYPPADTAAISTVQVTAPAKIMRIRPEQAEKIGGSYEMSNGWYLKVRTTSRYIDATIDEQRPIRLVAVAPYRFASGDGNVRMDFNRGEYGDDMLMSYLPAPGLAWVVVGSAPIAQR
ncbi:hypothetical protein ACFPQ5_11555 [Massilia suwonensis]|uniref:Uncharacterized protein n=2 Tax=Massilia suwonensis TaxID=648895 RepID=A0ABW0MNB1_9BURK